MQTAAQIPDVIRPCPAGLPPRDWFRLAAEMQAAGIAPTAQNRPVMAALLDTQRQLAALLESKLDLETNFSLWKKSLARDESGQLPLGLSPILLRPGRAGSAQFKKLRRLSAVERVVELLEYRIRTLRVELGMPDAPRQLRQPIP